MKPSRENLTKTSRSWVLGLVASIALLLLLAGACTTYQKQARTPPRESGILFDHAKHVDLDCATCHGEMADKTEPIFPGHDVCSACHDIPEDLADTSGCVTCHSSPEFSIERKPLLAAELKFVHSPHAAHDVACATCHKDPDTAPLPAGPLKPFCMDCHEKTSSALLECSVCHSETSRATIPSARGGTRIAHDAPQIWTKVHGQQSRVDPQFCNLCHDQQSSCDACHSEQEPSDHTLTWRRHTHGLQASWDRNRCDACHEEDTCIKCHENTEPASHRAGWGSPINRHCQNCHFPVEQSNNCVVCHERVEHPRALPSPHIFGRYPPNCAQCHPGGIPTRAPHAMNSSVRCVVCHK